MHPTRRVRLEDTMSRLAAGDPAFIWSLVEDFGDDLAGVVRATVGAAGRREVLSEPGRVEAMVFDIALCLFEQAASWDPDGGALPWVWARRAIDQIIWADLGHRCIELDELVVGPPPGAGPPEARSGGGAPAIDESLAEVTLLDLAVHDRRIARLIEAIGAVGSDRDGAVHTEYRIQRASGDPSPANTVADAFGLQAANVRQIDARMRRRLRHLAATDSSFSEIGDLKWLA